MFGLNELEQANAISMLIKLGVGALMAGLIGLERELREHPAGIRTHILLILGVILFTEASQGVGGDPGRIAAQIVTGVGFLCAGTILRTGTDVKGLTTSASLWATSGIGVVISLGGAYMVVGVCATLFSLLVLAGIAKIEKRYIKAAMSRTLKMTLSKPEALVDVLQQIHINPSAQISAVHVEQKEPEIEVSLQVRGGSETLLAEILTIDGVRIATLQ